MGCDKYYETADAEDKEFLTGGRKVRSKWL